MLFEFGLYMNKYLNFVCRKFWVSYCTSLIYMCLCTHLFVTKKTVIWLDSDYLLTPCSSFQAKVCQFSFVGRCLLFQRWLCCQSHYEYFLFWNNPPLLNICVRLTIRIKIPSAQCPTFNGCCYTAHIKKKTTTSLCCTVWSFIKRWANSDSQSTVQQAAFTSYIREQRDSNSRKCV